MQDLSVALSDGGISPGEAYLDNTPVLRAHAGTQPDLFLRWNRIPLSAQALDVVVHLHGFSQQGGEMPLAEKVERSGLDLSGRTRPTLAMLPRGNWIRHYYYDFPALLSGGIDQLVDYGVLAILPRRGIACRSRWIGSFSRLIPAAACRRSILLPRHPGHLTSFTSSMGFMAGTPRAAIHCEGWKSSTAGSATACGGSRSARAHCGSIYIEQQTGPFSRKVAELIARHLTGADPTRAASLSRRYRVESSGVQHSQIARRCMPELLTAPDAQFNWLA